MVEMRGSAPALGLIACVVLACAAPVSSPGESPQGQPTAATPTPSPVPSPTPRVTAGPTPEASPTGPAQDRSFSSTVYPYTIVLPGDALQPGPVAVVPAPGEWRASKQVWDGTTPFSLALPVHDSTADGKGDQVYVFGHPTDDDSAAFAARMINNLAIWLGCSRTPSTRMIDVDGQPAVLTSNECSEGAGSVQVARLYVTHGGFGLLFNLRSTQAGDPEEQMDTLERYVARVDLLP
jgi:hypothetical protein